MRGGIAKGVLCIYTDMPKKKCMASMRAMSMKKLYKLWLRREAERKRAGQSEDERREDGRTESSSE